MPSGDYLVSNVHFRIAPSLPGTCKVTDSELKKLLQDVSVKRFLSGPSLVVHTFDPIIWEAEAGEALWV